MPNEDSNNRQRAIGLAVTTALFLAVLTWWHCDAVRRRKPVYPPAPAALTQRVEWHLQALEALPLNRALKAGGVTSCSVGVASAPRPRASTALDRALAELRPSPPRESVDLLKANYTPLIEGDDTIAGRHAWVLRLKPSVKKRPWRQIWVDQRTFAIVAWREWNHTNGLRARGTFRDFRSAALRSNPETPAVEGRDVPVARYIPNGFRLVGLRTFPSHKTTQFVYSDGLFAISVFREFPFRQGREQKETASVYGSEAGLVLRQTRGNAEGVVIADLPAEEVRKIGRSFR